MRRNEGGEDIALPGGHTHEPEIARSEVTKPAVNQARGSPGCRPTKAPGVHQRHTKPCPRRVECDPGPDDAATDHQQVEHAPRQFFYRAFSMPADHCATCPAASRAAQSSTSPAITSKASEGSSGYTGRNTTPDII